MVRTSVKGETRTPLFRKLDQKVFGRKNAANLLLYGMGRLHRRYLLRKKVPILMRLLTGDGGCGPFPLNHPYYKYKVIDLHSSFTFEKATVFALLAVLFLGLNLATNMGFDPTTFLVAPLAAAAMFLMKLRGRKALLLLGVAHGLACYLLNGYQLNAEVLLPPVVYGLVVHRLTRIRRSIPCLRPEVEQMA